MNFLRRVIAPAITSNHLCSASCPSLLSAIALVSSSLCNSTSYYFESLLLGVVPIPAEYHRPRFSTSLMHIFATGLCTQIEITLPSNSPSYYFESLSLGDVPLPAGYRRPRFFDFASARLRRWAFRI